MGLEEIVKKEYVENDVTLCFRSTPLSKVIVLSILSFGFYDIILAYNFWKSLKQNFGYQVSPFWRGIFVTLTNFSLFPIFEKYFKSFNMKIYNPGILAGIYFTCTAIDNKISFKTAAIDQTIWPLEILSLILGIITTAIIAYIQNNINKANEQFFPEAPKNPWKISNVIWSVVLVLVWILVYIPVGE